MKLGQGLISLLIGSPSGYGFVSRNLLRQSSARLRHLLCEASQSADRTVEPAIPCFEWLRRATASIPKLRLLRRRPPSGARSATPHIAA